MAISKRHVFIVLRLNVQYLLQEHVGQIALAIKRLDEKEEASI